MVYPGCLDFSFDKPKTHSVCEVLMKKAKMYMGGFYSCGKWGRMAACQSWLTPDPPVIKTANTPLSTAARSLFVGIHSWQAWDTNISYRYLSFTTLPETFTVPQCLSREPTAAASAAGVSVFHRAPSGFTLLQQHGHNSLKLIFSCFEASPRKMTVWLIWRETLRSLPSSLLRAGSGKR